MELGVQTDLGKKRGGYLAYALAALIFVCYVGSYVGVRACISPTTDVDIAECGGRHHVFMLFKGFEGGTIDGLEYGPSVSELERPAALFFWPMLQLERLLGTGTYYTHLPPPVCPGG